MKSRLLDAVCVCAITFISLSAQAVGVSGQGTWETTLQGRDLDGNAATYEAYYDTTLNITWLADANANGVMTWDVANTWATNLNVNGVTGWRLPTVNPIDGTAFNNNLTYDGTTDWAYNISAPGTVYASSTASEMAHLFYNTLGNLNYCDPVLSDGVSCSGPQSGWGLSNTGPFSNLESEDYWSGAEYSPDLRFVSIFNFHAGYQETIPKPNTFYALAVRHGDVSVVPAPAAVWLFGSGLMGLIGIARRKKAA